MKWYNKVGYGSGDIAGNVIYAFLSTFMMFYLTEKVGMNIGIVGTLMALSKLFDGGPVLSTYLLGGYCSVHLLLYYLHPPERSILHRQQHCLRIPDSPCHQELL